MAEHPGEALVSFGLDSLLDSWKSSHPAGEFYQIWVFFDRTFDASSLEDGADVEE